MTCVLFVIRASLSTIGNDRRSPTALSSLQTPSARNYKTQRRPGQPLSVVAARPSRRGCQGFFLLYVLNDGKIYTALCPKPDIWCPGPEPLLRINQLVTKKSTRRSPTPRETTVVPALFPTLANSRTLCVIEFFTAHMEQGQNPGGFFCLRRTATTTPARRCGAGNRGRQAWCRGYSQTVRAWRCFFARPRKCFGQSRPTFASVPPLTFRLVTWQRMSFSWRWVCSAISRAGR